MATRCNLQTRRRARLATAVIFHGGLSPATQNDLSLVCLSGRDTEKTSVPRSTLIVGIMGAGGRADTLSLLSRRLYHGWHACAIGPRRRGTHRCAPGVVGSIRSSKGTAAERSGDPQRARSAPRFSFFAGGQPCAPQLLVCTGSWLLTTWETPPRTPVRLDRHQSAWVHACGL